MHQDLPFRFLRLPLLSSSLLLSSFPLSGATAGTAACAIASSMLTPSSAATSAFTRVSSAFIPAAFKTAVTPFSSTFLPAPCNMSAAYIYSIYNTSELLGFSSFFSSSWAMLTVDSSIACTLAFASIVLITSGIKIVALIARFLESLNAFCNN